MLAHTVAYNLRAAPQLKHVAAILGAPNAAVGLHELSKKMGAPMRLKDIGMKEQDLDRATDIICETPYPNPRPLESGAIRAMLENAFQGHHPQPDSMAYRT